MKNTDLILVIDMQNVYLKGQPWACLDTEGAAANAVKIVQTADRQNVPVIFTKYIAAEYPFGAWQDYNRTYADINSDPYLNALLPSIEKAARDHPLYEKSTYSAMTIPAVADAAAACTENGGRLVLTGVVSECCVLSTAFAAIDLGCHVLWLNDAVSGFDIPKERGAELMLKGLSPVHTAFMTTNEYLSE